MVLQCWSSAPYLNLNLNLNPNPIALFSQTYLLGFSDTKDYQSYHYNNNKYKYGSTSCRKPRRKTSNTGKFTCLLKLGVEDVAALVHNKVLIAAGVSAAIGQLSKPFTSVLLYGKDYDFKVAFQAGGFPSTHSSAVVATATSLALERGFSDSIFGLTVVYAGLVMYDAQGVRREVGNHAKALNKMLPKTQINSMVSKNTDDSINSQQGSSSISNAEDLGPLLSKEGGPLVPNSTNAPVLLKSDNKARQTSQMVVSSSVAAVEEGEDKIIYSSTLLKESIGHSEVEVIAGALLGFAVSIAVHAIM